MTEPTGTPRAVRSIPLIRWAGLGGAAYVLLFVIGFVVINAGEPGNSAAPQKVIEYYRDSGHREKVGLGWFLIVLGVFFFLWFLAALRQAVRRLAGSGVLAMVTTVGGGVYAALTLAAFSVDFALKTLSENSYKHTVYPELVNAGDDAAYILHSAAGAGAAAMMIAASLAALSSRAVPRWAAWLGVAAGISAIISIYLVPWFVIAVWLVVVSVIVFRAHVEEDPTF